jgi:hypothetical protein
MRLWPLKLKPTSSSPIARLTFTPSTIAAVVYTTASQPSPHILPHSLHRHVSCAYPPPTHNTHTTQTHTKVVRVFPNSPPGLQRQHHCSSRQSPRRTCGHAQQTRPNFHRQQVVASCIAPCSAEFTAVD